MVEVVKGEFAGVEDACKVDVKGAKVGRRGLLGLFCDGLRVSSLWSWRRSGRTFLHQPVETGDAGVGDDDVEVAAGRQRGCGFERGDLVRPGCDIAFGILVSGQR